MKKRARKRLEVRAGDTARPPDYETAAIGPGFTVDESPGIGHQVADHDFSGGDGGNFGGGGASGTFDSGGAE